MSKQIHLLSEIDAEERRGVCAECGPIGLKKKGPGWRCRNAWRANNRATKRRHTARKRHPYKTHKDDQCARCGFIAEHPSQLDVHHIDGDHSNNARSNLTTICANCHRLVHNAQ